MKQVPEVSGFDSKTDDDTFGYHDILATEGNLNNHLGAITMARLRPHHPFALFELGASAVGEIAYVAAMVRPIVSALLNARVAPRGLWIDRWCHSGKR